LNSTRQRLSVSEPDIDIECTQLDRGLLFSIAGAGIDRNHSGAERAQHPGAGRTRNADTGNADRQLMPRRIMGRCGQP
jgi:hypothetical protein